MVAAVPTWRATRGHMAGAGFYRCMKILAEELLWHCSSFAIFILWLFVYLEYSVKKKKKKKRETDLSLYIPAPAQLVRLPYDLLSYLSCGPFCAVGWEMAGLQERFDLRFAVCRALQLAASMTCSLPFPYMVKLMEVVLSLFTAAGMVRAEKWGSVKLYCGN